MTVWKCSFHVGQAGRGTLWVRRVSNPPVAPVSARTLWVARSLPSQCHSFFVPQLRQTGRGGLYRLCFSPGEACRILCGCSVSGKTSGIGLPSCPASGGCPLPGFRCAESDKREGSFAAAGGLQRQVHHLFHGLHVVQLHV